ncbi:hypothetical protein D4A39_04205 [Alcanivorax profundi]|uniref:Uncharacterized protein n=1 Tax=Alcanivorax profundi TaxID=2338368 RepID=A0A418Y449_9GAMM|nr:hypothetical protein D4A39_04205 [Alcanivorax profundi]
MDVTHGVRPEPMG